MNINSVNSLTKELKQNGIKNNIIDTEYRSYKLVDKMNEIFKSLGEIKLNNKIYFDKNTEKFRIIEKHEFKSLETNCRELAQ